jgi:hypothetical protein
MDFRDKLSLQFHPSPTLKTSQSGLVTSRSFQTLSAGPSVECILEHWCELQSKLDNSCETIHEIPTLFAGFKAKYRPREIELELAQDPLQLYRHTHQGIFRVQYDS